MKLFSQVVAVVLLMTVAAPVWAGNRAIIYLKEQPFPIVSRDLHSRAAPRIDALEREVKDSWRRSNPARGKTATAAGSRIALEFAKANRSAAQLSRKATSADQQVVAKAVRAAGGSVNYRYSIVNALAVTLPDEALDKIKRLPQVLRIKADRTLTAQLNISVPSIFAPTFWNSGWAGGEWRAAVLDTGVNVEHTGLVHLWTSRVFHEAALSDDLYDDDPNDPNSIHYHGTAVAGPIGCMHPTYRGVSYGVTRMINLKAGYRRSDGGGFMQASDMMAAIDWALTESDHPPNVLNFSFAGELGLEDSDLTRYWDSVVDACLVSSVIAAGNTSGPKNVREPSIGYNVIGVGAMFDGGTVDRSDDVIASFSSWGPTVGGRKKPDIVAPGGRAGSGIMLPNAGGSYGPGNGTSYAAPHITGAVALLGDMGVAHPITQKAILLTTAEDKGSPGWDQKFGWGYVDLAAAYACVSEGNYDRDSIGPSGGGDSVRYYTFRPDSEGKATLVWNRFVVYSGIEVPDTWYPLNDLDMFLYREDTNESMGSSESGIDNVEQVICSVPLNDGVVKVAAHNTVFSGVDREEFAVAANAPLAAVEGPKLEIEFPYVTFAPGGSATLTVTIRNTGGLNAHNVQASISSAAIGINGQNPQLLGMIPGGGHAEASWLVSAAGEGVYQVLCETQSKSYGESLSAAGEFSVYVGDSLGAIRLLPDDTTVTLVGKIVTATMESDVYIQEWDRSSAVLVRGMAGLSPGNVLQADGRLTTECSGRVVLVDSGEVVGQTTPPAPVYMLVRHIGGSAFGDYLPGVADGVGLSNLGLLVRIAGEVTFSNDSEFYVDDGSLPEGNTGPEGIRVVSYGLAKPLQGQRVVVTGISSAFDNGAGLCVRRLLIRSPDDVQEL